MIARSGHSATLLLTGKVLIAGGPNETAELYVPASETFTATGSMTVARSAHTATLLGDKALPHYGDVLIAAGGSQTAELYDPASGKFTATGSMLASHDQPTATLLQTGKVLIAGGGTASAELYNPATGTFTATGSLLVSLTGHTATLLANGKVLIAGGDDPTGTTSAAEIYDPASGKFTATGSMSEGRSGHTATLLLDGTVLVTGADSTAELYSSGTGTFSWWVSCSRGRDSEPHRHCVTTARSSSRAAVAGVEDSRNPGQSFSLPRVGASWRRVRSSRHGTDIRRRCWSMARCSLRAETTHTFTCHMGPGGGFVLPKTPCFRRLNCSSSRIGAAARAASQSRSRGQ